MANIVNVELHEGGAQVATATNGTTSNQNQNLALSGVTWTKGTDYLHYLQKKVHVKADFQNTSEGHFLNDMVIKGISNGGKDVRLEAG